MNGLSRLATLAMTLLLAACAGPSGPVPIDDRSRGGHRPPVTSAAMHTVQRGETLYQIAFRYGWDWKALAAANNMREPYTIFPGQQISLRGGQAQAVAQRQPQPAPVARPGSSASRPSVPVAAAPPAARQPPAAQRPVTPRPSTPAPALPANVSGWTWPVQGPLISRFQSNGSLNKGIDIAGQLGQPVKAAAQGAVVYAGRGLIGYGDMIIIKHDDVYLSAYGHNSRLLVSEGDQVRAGQVIAEMGSSGTDRVKLHFEIRRRGQPVDPLTYLPKS